MTTLKKKKKSTPKWCIKWSRKDLGIPGKTVWKCSPAFWAVAMGSKSAYKQRVGILCLPVLPEALQGLVGLCSNSCFRTFDLNLSESSSICPIFLHFRFIFCFFFYFFSVCWNGSDAFALQNVWAVSLRWSNKVYSYRFKENKLAQPKGLRRFASGGTCMDLETFLYAVLLEISIIYYLS